MEQQVQPVTWTLLLDERQHWHRHYTRVIQKITGRGRGPALRVHELEKIQRAKASELRYPRSRQSQLEFDIFRKEQSWELSSQQSRKAFDMDKDRFESENEILKPKLGWM